jgi:hypothetical protein
MPIFGKQYQSQISSYDAIVYIPLLLPLYLMSKYFISFSYLILSIFIIASNEIQSLTDAVLYNTKKTTLVSIHPSIYPSYGTTALASHNFCHQTVLFCAVSCQL